MKEITEEELHLYIINRNQLDAGTADEIERRALIDIEFRKNIDEIAEYYRNFEIYSNIDKEGVYLLLPMKDEYQANEQLTLAAQQNTTIEHGVKYIKTFISSEKYIMIRMFHNPELGKYEFYLVSDNLELVKNAVIKIPSLHKELITNTEGIAKLQIEYLPDDIELIVETH